MICTRISRASAGLLLLGGLALLFAPDDILPRLVPNFPSAGLWLGQMLGAALLGVGALNWLSKGILIGGIYGRHIVMANAVLYFMTTIVLLKIVVRTDVAAALWIVLIPAVLFAGIYGWLLFRGPFERDLVSYGRAQQKPS
jgi:hypothetical protein